MQFIDLTSHYLRKENMRDEKSHTIASVEPSIDHLVMSPFWITKALDADNGKRTTPPPPLETLAAAAAIAYTRNLLRLCFDFEFTPNFSMNREPEKMLHILSMFIEYVHMT